MRLEARPDLTPQECVDLFNAAVLAAPAVQDELLAGAKVVTVETDGERIVISSDRLEQPKVVPVKGGA